MSKPATICVLALLFLFPCLSSAAPTYRADVELIEPHHSWITYADSFYRYGELPHVARQVSKGHHVLDGPNSELSFTVRSGNHACLNCAPSSGTSNHRRSEFAIETRGAPSSAKAAIKKAADIMSKAWTSDVPVNMQISFKNIGEANVLANGGGTYFCRIRSLFDEILPIAAGEAILGRNLNDHKKDKGKFDVLITINTRAPWHYSTDGRPPSGKFDLVSVLLHEIYHNLLFTGGIFVDVRKKGDNVIQKAKIHDGHFTRFDAFLANKEGCGVLGYLKDKALKTKTGRTGDVLLADALTNGQLYFGYEAHGQMVKLFAPRVFRPKSSVYHLDPSNAGHDSIMMHEIEPGHAVHTIGPRILKMQALYLDDDVKGANTKCARPLSDPRKRGLSAEERSGVSTTNTYTPPPHIQTYPQFFDVHGRLPVGWIIALSILGVIILLTLCALLGCILYKLKKKLDDGKTSISSISSSDLYKYPGAGGGGVGQPQPSYPGGGGEKDYGGGYDGGYRVSTPTHTETDPPMIGVPIPTPSKKTKSSYPSSAKPPSRKPPSTKPPSAKPPSTKPPSTKPPSSCKKSSRHSAPPSRKPASSKRPSSAGRKPRSSAPPTESYFDCS